RVGLITSLIGDCEARMLARTLERWLLGTVLVLSLAPWCVAAKDPQGSDKTDSAKAKTSQPADKKSSNSTHEKIDPSQYVGAETCKTCHEDAARGYDKGPHWKTTLANHEGPEWQGCEACHGPGKAHAESADPSKIIR